MEGLLKAPSESFEARIAFTEDFFRKLNLGQAESAFRDHGGAYIQCECWQERCGERISLSAEEWARVRAQGNRFAVAPNHVAKRFEAVLTTYPSFWLIEKFGEAGEIAEELERLERAATAAVRAGAERERSEVTHRRNSRAGIPALRG
jgi:hypothetical protein